MRLMLAGDLRKHLSNIFIFIAPVLVASVYLFWARLQLKISPRVIFIHGMVLLFWGGGALLVSIIVHRVLAKKAPRAAVTFSALIPAVGYLALTGIYICSVIGVLNWGKTMTCAILLSALPELFNISRSLSIPSTFVFLIVVFPPILFVAVYRFCHLGKSSFYGWFSHIAAKHFSVSRRQLGVLVTICWICLGCWLVSISDHFWIWDGEPIFDFFLGEKKTRAMNAERRLWAVRDAAVRKALPKQTPSVQNIIVFVVDSMRSDHLSVYGYDQITDPYLRTLSSRKSFRLVETALSNANESIGGVSAILTSKNLTCISDLSFNLIDCLVDQGFDATVIDAGNQRWYGLGNAFGKNVRTEIDGVGHPGPNGFADDEMLVQQAALLKPAGNSRHFFFFRLMSVHEIGFLKEQFRRASIRSVKGENIGVPNPDCPPDFYDQRILQADDVIRRVLEQMETKGYLKNYLCVVTADHGQLLGENGNFGHARGMGYGAIRIPILFLGSAELPVFLNSDFAVQLDIAPTIVDLAGLQIPSSWQGTSLCRGKTAQWSFHESASPYRLSEGAVVYRDALHVYKYSFPVMDPNNVSKQRLLDLKVDPAEKTNLIDSPFLDPLLLDQMRQRSRGHFSVIEQWTASK